MIGTNVRGLRHLWRLSGPFLKEALINFKDCGSCFCHIFKTDEDSSCGELLLIFNTKFNVSRNKMSAYHIPDDVANFVNKAYSRVIEIRDFDNANAFDFISSVILLPDDCEE